MSYTTLSNLLLERSTLTTRGVTFIEKGNQETFLSYKELYDAALNALGHLQNRGVSPADELVMQVEDNKTFVIIFWACILGGIIPVPLTIGQNESHKQKLFTVWQVLNNPWLCIAAGNLQKTKIFAEEKKETTLFATMESRVIDTAQATASVNKGEPVAVKENDIAFIQFSSGSTGNSKGVMLTHRNLVSNMKGISKAAFYSENDSMISWMPLTHDMGLIGFHLNPLYCGMDQYLMPPALFVLRPDTWLDKASEHKVTILCSPNFGYSYVLRHCDVAAKNWDLSKVRIIYNGAEPISEKLCYRFLDACSRFGLKRYAMCPVYGLAEASLAVSISGMEDEVIAIQLDRNKLKPGDTISITSQEQEKVSFVNVGKPIEDCELRITALDNTPLPDGTVGLVQIKGESVTSGYYNNIEETNKCLLPGGWLNTGDLGFIKDGAFYITGRAKDIIFVNGQNYYPHDIEAIAQEVEGVELNKIVVAGHFNDTLQKEECIVFVFHRGSAAEFLPLSASLKAHINSKTGLEVDKILPVTDIPRTTSGKLQRFKLIELYKQGKFAAIEQGLEELKAVTATQIREPETPTEKQLLTTWNAILETESKNIDQSFFELGGNSLKAASLCMLILKELETELLPDVIYEKQTVRKIAGEIDRLGKTAYTPVPVATVKDRYPISPAQKGIYHFCQLHPESVCYNIPLAFKIKGKLDIPKLENCLRQLVQRHDALRTSFVAGQAIIQEHIIFFLQQYNCTSAELDKKLHSLLQPFNLENAPLCRACVVNVENSYDVLFLDFHHSIADGISVWKLVGEMLQLYAGNTLPFLPVQYKDYAYWKKEQTGNLQQQQAYWLAHLRGELPVLELPLDYARPSAFSYKGARLSFEMAAEITAQLKALATAQQCTLHELLFTLYTIMLAKYSGQEELITGIAVSGRRHPDILNVAGMFVNNLAIRSRIRANDSFIQLLNIQNETIRAALHQQDYPFDELAGQLDIKRNISRNPVFDTMFVYQNMPSTGFTTAELSLTRIDLDPLISKFDLSLEVIEEPGSLHCSIEYCTDLFRQQTIQHFITHFQTLASRVINAPNTSLQQLSLIPTAEYEAWMIGMNATQKEYSGSKIIHQLFEAQVEKTPGNIALEFEDSCTTYAALNSTANQLAAILRQKGIVKGSIVALLQERTPELITAMLAVLKAGGCFLPIDPAWPAERIQFVLENSRCQLLISNETVLRNTGLNNAALPAVIDSNSYKELTGSYTNIENQNTPNDLCYIIYTSGTTGYPKGVMIGHKSAANYILWAKEQYVREDAMDFPFYTSVAFDLTITSVFTPLLSGNRVVIYKEVANEFLLEKVIAENKVDSIKLTPSHLKLITGIMNEQQATACRIKRMIVGGEQLETVLAKKIHDLFSGNIEIYNEYGPTEATVGCMIHRFSVSDPGASVPIGIPAANTRIYILDKYLQPVPVGVYGELFIAGTGLARGYLFNDTLTAEKFLSDPFVPGEKMYKTGDIARRLYTGIIEYQGRRDQQIKLNGYRVELSEIQSQLITHPGIEEALVTIHTTGNQQKVLCAYYTSNNSIDSVLLRNYLATRLPFYMLPAHFVPLTQIPLTANGKVNYEALPLPVIENEKEGSSAPQSEIEEAFIEVWQELLGESNISVNDNFYELGGDSIKAIQVASRLLEKGITVNVKDILTYHTIRHISLYASKNAATSIYIQQEVKGERPLLPIEKWFFAHAFKNAGCYNQSVLLKFNRSINIAYLELVMEALVRHHDGLRLNYNLSQQTMFYNPVHAESKIPIDVVNTGIHNYTHTFDITKDLLIKAIKGKAADGSDLLLLVAHHLVMDGISWRILLQDLYHWYTVLEQGKEMNRLSKTASSLDWQQEYAATATQAVAEKEYWCKTADVDFTIPQDADITDWAYEQLGKCHATLSRESTQSLTIDGNKIFKSDIGLLVNVSLALALCQWTGSDTIKMELENHGRHLTTIDISRTTGWFTVIHPVVIHIPPTSIHEQVKAIKEQLKAVPNHGMGYGHYSALPGLTKAMTAVRFNYLGRFGTELNNELFEYIRRDIATETDPANTMTAQLELNALIINGQLELELLYNTKAHHYASINRLMNLIISNIESIITYMRQQKEVQFTPSDFSAVTLDQDELNSLFQ